MSAAGGCTQEAVDAAGNPVQVTPFQAVLATLARSFRRSDESLGNKPKKFDFYTLHRGLALSIKGKPHSFEISRDSPKDPPECQLSAESRQSKDVEGAPRTELYVSSLKCNGGGMTLLDVAAQVGSALGHTRLTLLDESRHPTSGIPTRIYFPLCRQTEGLSFYHKACKTLLERRLVTHCLMVGDAVKRIPKLQAELALAAGATMAQFGDKRRTWGDFVCNDAMRSSEEVATRQMAGLPPTMKALIVELEKINVLYEFTLPRFAGRVQVQEHMVLSPATAPDDAACGDRKRARGALGE